MVTKMESRFKFTQAALRTDFWSAQCVKLKSSLGAVINELNARVSAKDRQGNDVLLLECGLPDERGFACPADSFMFQFVLERAHKTFFSPHYLKSIVLHLWSTDQWFEMFREDAYSGWPLERM